MGLNTNNEFKKLYCFGIAAWVLFQTVVNLGGAVGIVPITGMVLPFVSYGSSAMVSIFVGFGVMYSISDE